MSSEPIAVPYRRVPVSIVSALLVAAFAIGALTGLVVPRVLDAGGRVSGASSATQAFKGVAENNMSDAARSARLAAGRQAFKGVADNNMSDAAYAAQYGRDRR
jgi:hypothetical protein